jgi:DNA-binding HxlR family transcriptional regulator
MQNFHHIGFCPVRDLLAHVGNKWSTLVLVTLYANGTLRFGDLQRTIGDISQRMLTVTLRQLEIDGMIERTVFPEVPPRVEYNLTDKGRSLMPLMQALINWALENQPKESIKA